jgi:hypothetical protein
MYHHAQCYFVFFYKFQLSILSDCRCRPTQGRWSCLLLVGFLIPAASPSHPKTLVDPKVILHLWLPPVGLVSQFPRLYGPRELSWWLTYPLETPFLSPTYFY